MIFLSDTCVKNSEFKANKINNRCRKQDMNINFNRVNTHNLQTYLT